MVIDPFRCAILGWKHHLFWSQTPPPIYSKYIFHNAVTLVVKHQMIYAKYHTTVLVHYGIVVDRLVAPGLQREDSRVDLAPPTHPGVGLGEVHAQVDESRLERVETNGLKGVKPKCYLHELKHECFQHAGGRADVFNLHHPPPSITQQHTHTGVHYTQTQST